MNKIFSLTTLAIMSVLFYASCESNPAGGVPDRTVAPNVIIDQKQFISNFIDVSDTGTKFDFTMMSFGDVASAQIYVSRNSNRNAVDGAGNLLLKPIGESITNFPANVSITYSQLNTIFGAVEAGRYYFWTDVTDGDGKIWTEDNLEDDGDAANPGQEYAYSFSLVGFCFNADDIVGTYTIRSTATGGNGAFFAGQFGIPLVEDPSITRQVDVTGDGIVIRGFNSTVGTDMLLTFDDQGVISINMQPSGYAHPTFGPVSLNSRGNGVFLTCQGNLTFTASHLVAAGNFGNFTYTLIKQ